MLPVLIAISMSKARRAVARFQDLKTGIRSSFIMLIRLGLFSVAIIFVLIFDAVYSEKVLTSLPRLVIASCEYHTFNLF
jgi:hypothetical protein